MFLRYEDVKICVGKARFQFLKKKPTTTTKTLFLGLNNLQTVDKIELCIFHGSQITDGKET